MFDFLKANSEKPEMTSLNLEASSTPQVPPALSAAALQETMQRTQAAARESGVKAEIDRRIKELLASGQRPSVICFLRDTRTHNPVLLLPKDPPRKALLIFGSPMLAHFFARTKQLPVEVVGVKPDEITPAAENWRTLGIDGYILDLSPKAPVFNVLSVTDNRLTSEQIVFAWATQRVARNWQAQRILSGAFSKESAGVPGPEGLKKQRTALESLRDFGSFDVPFVHWMIALIAGMQNDEEARLAATATLESFGPAFVGKTARLEGREGEKVWADSMTTAHVGLMAEFGMLKGPDGSPVGSMLKTETHPASTTQQ